MTATINPVTLPQLCRWGHPLTEANTRQRVDGGLRCLSCARRSARAAMARARTRARVAAAPPLPVARKEYKRSKPRPAPPIPNGEKAVIMCGGRFESRFFDYPSLAAALVADCPNRHCEGQHTIAYRTGGRLHVWAPPPPAPDLHESCAGCIRPMTARAEGATDGPDRRRQARP